MNFFRFFDGKVGGGAEWFLPSNLIHFAHRKTLAEDIQWAYHLSVSFVVALSHRKRRILLLPPTHALFFF